MWENLSVTETSSFLGNADYSTENKAVQAVVESEDFPAKMSSCNEHAMVDNGV